MTRDHVLFLNRWHDDRAARYARYLDHDRWRVSYLTTAESEQALRAALSGHPATIVATDIGALDAVHEAACRLQALQGRLAGLVALAERDLLAAAHLRERLGLPGTWPAAMLPRRDKHLMKQAVAAAAVRVPRFAAGDDPGAVRGLVDDAGWPIVVKPRTEAGSVGVTLARGWDDLCRALQGSPASTLECEEFMEGRLFHADGLVVNGAVRLFAVFEYVNTPLLYVTDGLGSGAAMVDDPGLVRHGRVMAEAVARALDLRDDAFHLEFFLLDTGDTCFLEVGARVGGGPVSRLLREVTGVDLVRQHVRLQLGLPVEPPSERPPAEVGGYLMLPEPKRRPCRVTAVEVPGDLPTLSASQVPEVDAVLDGTAHHLNACAVFLYRGGSTADVLRDIRATERLFALDCEPVG
jgi:biotin carboxylase